MEKASDIVATIIAVVIALVLAILLLAVVLGILLIAAGLIWAGVMAVWGWIL